MKVESVKSVFIFLLKARIFKLGVQDSVPIFLFIVIPPNNINKRSSRIDTYLTIKKKNPTDDPPIVQCMFSFQEVDVFCTSA